MDKEKFFTMTPSKRVQEINNLLQKYDLKEISELIGIPSSSLSKHMREGDYFYHQADKKYYPFVRSEEDRVSKLDNRNNAELDFIKNNLDDLQKILSLYQRSNLLMLDKRIYNRDAKYVNKSIKMNNDIYEGFSKFCDEYFPQYKMQDLIAQSLIDLMNRYKPENKRAEL